MSLVCSSCSLNLPCNGEYITCNKCTRILHFDCGGVAANTWRGKSSSSKAKYACKFCQNSKSHPATPTSNTTDTVNILLEIKEDINVIRDQMNRLQASFNELQNVFVQNEQKLNAVLTENEQLREANTLLQQRFDSLEQYTRMNNLIISNIPQAHNENILEIIRKISKAAGVSLVESDIDYFYRLPKSKNQQHPSIVVKFCRRTQKLDFLKKARQKHLSLNDIGFDSALKQQIYINDHLSPLNSKLFAAARGLRALGWKYIWTRHYKVLAWRNDASSIIRVISLEHVQNLSNKAI